MESDTADDDVVLAAEEAVNADAVEKAVNTKTPHEIDYVEEAEDVEASDKDSAAKLAEQVVVSVNEVKIVENEEIGAIDAEEARLNDKTVSNKDSNIDNDIDGEEFRDYRILWKVIQLKMMCWQLKKLSMLKKLKKLLTLRQLKKLIMPKKLKT